MVITQIDDGGLITKDPDDYLPLEFDYNDDLASSASLTTSAWIVEAVKPSKTDAALLVDNDSYAARAAYARLTGGTLGQVYRLTNRFETNENTLPREDRSILVLIQ